MVPAYSIGYTFNQEENLYSLRGRFLLPGNPSARPTLFVALRDCKSIRPPGAEMLFLTYLDPELDPYTWVTAPKTMGWSPLFYGQFEGPGSGKRIHKVCPLMETCQLMCFVSPKTIGPLISDSGVKG